MEQAFASQGSAWLGGTVTDKYGRYEAHVRPGKTLTVSIESGSAAGLYGLPEWHVVKAETGPIYTRDGSFRLDDKQRLVTAHGLPVQGTGGDIVMDGSSFSVSADGTVMVDGRPAGRLRVVAFSDPGGMDHRGNGMVVARDNVDVTDLPREEVHVVQGHLEQSNVNPIDTLVDMIAAQRSFEVKAKMLTANDELLGKSVNQLGRVR